jgi:pre-mRNA-splicing factor CDC5/CEF1
MSLDSSPLQAEFEAARSEMEREARRAARLEEKVTVLVAGLQNRDTDLRKRIARAWEALQAVQTEYACFKVSLSAGSWAEIHQLV